MSKVISETVSIVPIADAHVEGFHAALDYVSRERKYLSFLEAPPLDSTRDFVTSTREKGNPQFVALDAGKVVGWCDISRSTKATRQHCGTLGIGLLPAYRGQGIGTRLLRTTIADAFERGIKRIELEVYAHNTNAHALYQKIGFQDEGVRKKAFCLDGAYQDVYVMGLLSPSLKDQAHDR